MLTRLATGRASPARSRGVSRAILAQPDLAARPKVTDRVRPSAIQGTDGSVYFRCLRRAAVVIVPRGRGVDWSNGRRGGNFTFFFLAALPWFLNLYYPLLTLDLLCILHVIVRCLFIVIVYFVEGQRPVHLIPHLHCWLALIVIVIDILYSTGTVFNILIIHRTTLYTRDNLAKPTPAQ